ncbi:MAG: glycosyltransferase family 2 protein [Bacteroidota bacterium]
MKVSIITVSFNAASTLKQTIESVLAQDYPNIEYWVIDGGSTDGTKELLESYGSRIHYISEPDRGIYDAFNKGLARVTGEFVGVIGADDFYPTPDVIRSVVDTFDREQVDSVYGDLQFIDPESLKVVRQWKAGAYKQSSWLWGWMPPHPAFFVKRSVYEQFGYYQTHYTCAGDYEWMLRALYKHGISVAYLPKLLMTMRTGGTSTASWKHRWVANREDRRAWRENGLKPYFFTVTLKPLRKIIQLLS